MIRTVAALLTLALASATTENLRGNSNNDNQVVASSPDERRVLTDMDMNIGLGEMICKERLPVDGSVVCTFRTIPPKDTVTDYVHHDCLNAGGSNFCLGIEVSRIRYGDVPDSAFQVQQPPPQQQQEQQQPPPQQQQQQQVTVGSVGRCPSFPQATGMACAQYVPTRATEISCYFGRTKCDCKLENAVTQGWSCGLIPDTVTQPEVVVTNPVTNPITATPPVQNINANIQSAVVVSPTQAPVRVTSGQVLPIFNNPSYCSATKPNDGESCEWGQRCYYYVEENGVKVDAVSCDCNWSCVIECRDATHPLLQAF